MRSTATCRRARDRPADPTPARRPALPARRPLPPPDRRPCPRRNGHRTRTPGGKGLACEGRVRKAPRCCRGHRRPSPAAPGIAPGLTMQPSQATPLWEGPERQGKGSIGKQPGHGNGFAIGTGPQIGNMAIAHRNSWRVKSGFLPHVQSNALRFFVSLAAAAVSIIPSCCFGHCLRQRGGIRKCDGTRVPACPAEDFRRDGMVVDAPSKGSSSGGVPWDWGHLFRMVVNTGFPPRPSRCASRHAHERDL